MSGADFGRLVTSTACALLRRDPAAAFGVYAIRAELERRRVLPPQAIDYRAAHLLAAVERGSVVRLLSAGVAS